MSNPHGLTVGQTLYWVPYSHRGQHSFVSVEKIGRKWAHLSNHNRIELETLRADSGDHSCPGQCWLSKEAHDAEKSRADAWHELLRKLRYMAPPAGVTTDDIAAARKLLRLDPEEAK